MRRLRVWAWTVVFAAVLVALSACGGSGGGSSSGRAEWDDAQWDNANWEP